MHELRQPGWIWRASFKQITCLHQRIGTNSGQRVLQDYRNLPSLHHQLSRTLAARRSPHIRTCKPAALAATLATPGTSRGTGTAMQWALKPPTHLQVTPWTHVLAPVYVSWLPAIRPRSLLACRRAQPCCPSAMHGVRNIAALVLPRLGGRCMRPGHRDPARLVRGLEAHHVAGCQLGSHGLDLGLEAGGLRLLSSHPVQHLLSDISIRCQLTYGPCWVLTVWVPGL